MTTLDNALNQTNFDDGLGRLKVVELGNESRPQTFNLNKIDTLGLIYDSDIKECFTSNSIGNNGSSLTLTTASGKYVFTNIKNVKKILICKKDAVESAEEYTPNS